MLSKIYRTTVKMKTIIRIIFLLFIFSQATICLGLPDSTLQDNTNISIRKFDQGAISDYKADEAFNYGYKPVEGLSLWDSFVQWLGRLLSGLFYFGTETPIGKYTLIALAVAISIYALLKILKVKTNLFHSNKTIYKAQENIHDENIHELDLAALITQALKEENYRNAIRLTYLAALKALSDKDLVRWIPGKTNNDYLYEIKSSEIKSGFKDLGYYFTYTWYGNFKVNESHYFKVKSIFDDWNSNVNK